MYPAPPVDTRFSWLQPRVPCEEFQDLLFQLSLRPMRSWWPTIADPSALLVQFLHVVSPPAVENLPDGSEPVRMSCSFGLSPRALIGSPFSLRAVSLLMLTFSEWRS